MLNAQIISEAVKKAGRKPRNPSHDFALSTMPYAIQPFAIAPVLPGETMKNALLQARVVTDPIRNPLIGWWSEWYLFYVKLRDLDKRDALTDMILTPGRAVNDLVGGYDPDCYTGNGQMAYVRMCLDRVVSEYFRDEGDNPPLLQFLTSAVGLPPATIATRERWSQSAKLASQVVVDDGELPGEGLDVEPVPGFEQHHEQWRHMRALELTTATFEDWLRQFGVKTPKAQDPEEEHRPELLRYVRDWTYPSNSVDATDGSVSSVCSWSIAERADKDRFFKEPGFIFGVTVTRPKIYMGRQNGSAVTMLNDAFSWLPAVLANEPYTSLKKLAPTVGPLGSDSDLYRPSEDIWVDIKDLFLYGDQFTNLNGNDAGQAQEWNMVARPKSNLERRYLSVPEIQTLFKGANTRVRIDGVLNLNIHGAQTETS